MDDIDDFTEEIEKKYPVASEEEVNPSPAPETELDPELVESWEKLYNLTTEHKIRLECLKIAYTPNKSAADVVEKAKVLEQYVNGSSSEPNDKQG